MSAAIEKSCFPHKHGCGERALYLKHHNTYEVFLNFPRAIHIYRIEISNKGVKWLYIILADFVYFLHEIHTIA